MAPSKRSTTAKGFYYQLHNLSLALNINTKPSIIKTYPKLFLVERIITKRATNKDEKYLIKWLGWPLESCSWEPASHLTSQLLRNYLNPVRPSEDRLQEAARNFYSAIHSGLKGKSIAPIYVNMDLDIWRYISNTKGIPSEHKGHTLYQKEDFNLFCTLPSNWWFYLDQNLQGQAIDFPLKIKPILSWTSKTYVYSDCNGKPIPAPRMPIEKLCITMAKRACSADTLLTV